MKPMYINEVNQVKKQTLVPLITFLLGICLISLIVYLNPGTIIGRDSQVYPLSCVRGVVKARHIVKGERGTFAKA